MKFCALEVKDHLHTLSQTQEDILVARLSGETSTAIAKRLGMSVHTVRTIARTAARNIRRILEKKT